MSTEKTTNNVPSIAEVAEALITLLTREEIIVQNMGVQLEKQLTAVRDRDRDQIEEATLETSREISRLMAIQMDRTRQVESLAALMDQQTGLPRLEDLAAQLAKSPATEETGNKLLELYQQLKNSADHTRENGRALTYTLQFAMHLGHSLLEAVQGLNGPSPVEWYTADGRREKTNGARSFVNQVG